MSKAKTAAEKDFATAEINFNAGADALKAGFDKAIKGYDSVRRLRQGHRRSADQVRHRRRQGRRDAAITRFTPTPSSRWKTPSPPARRSWAPSRCTKRSKSRPAIAKSAFETYVAELTKFSELFTAAAKDSFAPLQGRAQAWVDVVQTSTAA